MTAESEIYDVLTGDATLMALLTGGVYINTTISEIAINRNTTTSAFQSGDMSFLKPLLIIKTGVERAWGGLYDINTSYQSTYKLDELWYYDDRGAGYNTLRSASNRVYTLLNGRGVDGAFDVKRISLIEGRDSAYNQVPFINEQWAVVGYWTES